MEEQTSVEATVQVNQNYSSYRLSHTVNTLTEVSITTEIQQLSAYHSQVTRHYTDLYNALIVGVGVITQTRLH